MSDDIELLDAEFDELLAEEPIQPKELVDEKPKPASKPAPVKAEAPKSAPEVAPKKEAPAKETEEVAGVNNIKFGATYSIAPIPRFKGSKDNKARIALLSTNVKSISMHYKEGIGSFLCFNGACCDHLGDPRIRYVLPIVQYTTDKNGNISDKSWEVKALSLGTESYKNLVDVVNMSGRDVTNVDILVSCSDDTYQKLTFAADASRPCAWKSFPDKAEIVKFYKENINKIHLAVGRSISEEAFLRRLGVVDPKQQEKIPEPSNQTPPDLNLLLEDE